MSRKSKKPVLLGDKSYALSNDDINYILDPETNIFTYPELEERPTIDDCFDELGRCIVLYLTQGPNSGHWVCLWKNEKGIHYFDPYGDAPEEPRQAVGGAWGQKQPYLTHLLKNAQCPVYYNIYPYQSERRDVATCGKHCVTRLVCKDMTDTAYYKMIKKSGLTPDQYVCNFIAEYLGK